MRIVATGRSHRRPLLVLVGVFLGLSALGGATGMALGTTGTASFERGDAAHHLDDRGVSGWRSRRR